MKRLLLVAFLSLLSVAGFAQNINPLASKNMVTGIYVGGGIALAHNYNVAPTAGFYVMKGFFERGFFGADLFYQTYALRYDNEQNGLKNGTGISGAILKHASSYVFVAPKFEYGFRRTQSLKVYLNVGVGFKVGGFDTLRKWDHSYNSPSVNNYDSTVDLSKNLNSMQIRVAFGLKQYLYMGRHWRFTFTEDFAFLASSLTKTGDADAPGRTQYYPHKVSPAYFSIDIGICHTRYP